MKLFSEGQKPNVAFVVSISDDFNIYYRGSTVFENKELKYHTNVDLDKFVTEALNRLLLSEGKVNFVFLSTTEAQHLENSLNNNLEHFNENPFDKENLSDISKWGEAKQFDYIAFVFSGSYIKHSTYVERKGNNIVADFTGNSTTTGIYKIQLVDVKTGRMADYAQETAYRKNSNFKKNLSQDEIDQITKDWKASQEYDYNDSLNSPFLENVINQARLYSAEDYAKLSQAEIDDSIQRLLPSVYEKLTKLLVQVGFSERPVQGDFWKRITQPLY
ncbi:MAG: hypothetical protein JAY90_13420 [Candidatus Thiodiazotropha lotti]|nr:hypothetical protein [Candidatus Thiodiazotropha lotti]